ncbi:helix-turn-helix transcriptional regulator [Pseudomonas aeruginosa]|uniref:helix-turn-helix transcriptional regulator n=1 Tax=Pseudomonas aeruginosa TaxID=287 RepID=UPI003C6E3BE7
MDDRLIKATEVCQLIGRGKTTLYNLIRSGAFPPPKKNGPTRQAGVYFSERQVLAWIADHRGNSLPTDGLRLSPKPNEIQQEVLYVADVASFLASLSLQSELPCGHRPSGCLLASRLVRSTFGLGRICFHS